MYRFYLLPIETVSAARGPKYLKWRFGPDGLDVTWAGMDYGLMPVMLVAADVDEAQHAEISEHEDVIAVPANIDANITAQALPAVEAALEALHIPADWVTTAYTYRQILRGVAGLFQLAQRYHGRGLGRLIEQGVSLETRINQLPAGLVQNLNETAQSLGWSTDGIAGTWRLRRALMFLAQQWGEATFHMGGVDL